MSGYQVDNYKIDVKKIPEGKHQGKAFTVTVTPQDPESGEYAQMATLCLQNGELAVLSDDTIIETCDDLTDDLEARVSEHLKSTEGELHFEPLYAEIESENNTDNDSIDRDSNKSFSAASSEPYLQPESEPEDFYQFSIDAVWDEDIEGYREPHAYETIGTESESESESDYDGFDSEPHAYETIGTESESEDTEYSEPQDTLKQIKRQATMGWDGKAAKEHLAPVPNALQQAHRSTQIERQATMDWDGKVLKERLAPVLNALQLAHRSIEQFSSIVLDERMGLIKKRVRKPTVLAPMDQLRHMEPERFKGLLKSAIQATSSSVKIVQAITAAFQPDYETISGIKPKRQTTRRRSKQSTIKRQETLRLREEGEQKHNPLYDSDGETRETFYANGLPTEGAYEKPVAVSRKGSNGSVYSMDNPFEFDKAQQPTSTLPFSQFAQGSYEYDDSLAAEEVRRQSSGNMQPG